MSRDFTFPILEEMEEKRELEIRELTMQNGIEFPSNYELIMLILGSGTKTMPIKELSIRVLATVMESNSDNLVENLVKLHGIGKTKALVIAAAIELGKRLNRNPQGFLQSPIEVIPYIQNYALQRQEHFLCVSLNGAGEILSIRVICTGAGNMAIVSPCEVFSEAIKERASAVVLSHNHPSGNPHPSKADIKTTLRLYKAADLLGISVLDHIILCKNDYFSFSENGLLDEESLEIALTVEPVEEFSLTKKQIPKGIEEKKSL